MADILVVDDNPDGADALAAAMRLEGHEVRIAYDGQEGLRLLHERLPDLALLDVEMPILGGPGLAHQMFVHDCGMEDVPIVFLSGVDDLRAVAREVGTPYFLRKPFEYEAVLAMVQRALAERAPPRPEAVTPGAR